MRVLFLYGIRCMMELEESGPPNGRVKKCPVDLFLARGRVPLSTPDKLPDLIQLGSGNFIYMARKSWNYPRK